MLKAIGWIFTLGAIGSAVGEVCGLNLPTLGWGFELSRNVPGLSIGSANGGDGWVFPWFGWVATMLAFLFGIAVLIKFSCKGALTPITLRKIQRFKSIKRGYYSFLLLLFMVAIASLDHALVGNEALVVKHKGAWSFPAFSRDVEKGDRFGLEGDDAVSPPDYRELKEQFKQAGEGDWVLMPLWPYGPTGDNIAATSEPLKIGEDGLAMEGGEPYKGLACRVFNVRQPEEIHLRYRYREGLKHGRVDGWDRERNRIYEAQYDKGVLMSGSEKWNGEGTVEEFFALTPEEYHQVHFPAARPTLASAPRHPLGTTSQGYDVIAYLYGGLMVNFHAALIYIPLVYAIGVSIGLLMGYFGGTFDLLVQRIIEILSNIPFLFLVIIVSTAVPPTWKDRFGLYVILAILAAFGWMGMTYLMRTAALKEKARDYIAASRVLGASTPRILFKHLLPNSVAIVVTLIPFSVSGLVLALTSLDYLGFGLPPKYATWGKLLRDGLENLSSPWLVTSAFLALVVLLILVTFVGEAVREAFDPKKYTFYR